MNKDDLIEYKREVEAQKRVYRVGKDRISSRELLNLSNVERKETPCWNDNFDFDLKWWNEALADKAKKEYVNYDTVDFKYYIGLYYDSEELEAVGLENYKEIKPIENIIYVELVDDTCYYDGKALDFKRFNSYNHPTRFSVMSFNLFKHKLKKFGLETKEINKFEDLVNLLYETDFELFPARLVYNKKNIETKNDIEEKTSDEEIEEIMQKLNETKTAKTKVKKIFRNRG